MMIYLSDEALLNAYKKALRLKLERDFIDLLMIELDRRGIAFRNYETELLTELTAE
ncbi:developmental checkpoint coupling sporulation initiation to replication initiation [Virgibacillus subterraneus]|uniref:Developmental checkpoint coupling sporulation initiation to replication initiation n=2 Tax=Virgibacillus TaxID=84406 RepID=A0A1H1ELL7_9BACI|nr:MULTISPECIES: sporulation histidine kinase inhibitor Sda [Virgibacillus]SDQ89647.1 developmental checkpoint coupling sporulation initiation to replication initiation [Virgibacillus salinus]SEQ45110.1 developmental checkpoint coupling sporulation initiation to replication initiation [Virgibacillus subterraneus]